MRERLTGLESSKAVDVCRTADGPFDRRTFAFDEVEIEAHRREWKQQVRKKNSGIDVDRVDRLQRDGNRQLRLRDDVEKAITLPERTVLRHVATRLTHEPDRSPVDGLAAASAKKAVVHEISVRARAIRSSSQSGLNRIDAPSDLSSCWMGSDRK